MQQKQIDRPHAASIDRRVAAGLIESFTLFCAVGWLMPKASRHRRNRTHARPCRRRAADTRAALLPSSRLTAVVVALHTRVAKEGRQGNEHVKQGAFLPPPGVRVEIGMPNDRRLAEGPRLAACFNRFWSADLTYHSDRSNREVNCHYNCQHTPSASSSSSSAAAVAAMVMVAAGAPAADSGTSTGPAVPAAAAAAPAAAAAVAPQVAVVADEAIPPEEEEDEPPPGIEDGRAPLLAVVIPPVM